MPVAERPVASQTLSKPSSLTRPASSVLWEAARYIYRSTMRWRGKFPFPLIPTFFTPKEQILNVAMAYAQFNKIEGDYLEFGTYQGNSFLMSYHLARGYHLDKMRFYAFDSFEGLPPVAADESDSFHAGEYSCDLSTFKKTLLQHGADMNHVTIVPGFYDKVLTEETKKKLPLRAAAIVMIDCDLESSTTCALDFVRDYLINGSVLIFDDWFTTKGDPNRGEIKAFREWLKRNPNIRASEYQKFSWHGNSFIVHL